MQQRRVGTLTFGILLIIFGILYLCIAIFKLPLQGILVFHNPINVESDSNTTFNNIYVNSNMNITFPIEGDYKPIIGLEFKDNSTTYFEAKNTVLHVYPREQLKQLETERVSLESDLASLELSKAVFILSTIAVISIVVQIFRGSDG